LGFRRRDRAKAGFIPAAWGWAAGRNNVSVTGLARVSSSAITASHAEEHHAEASRHHAEHHGEH
jgi:hypothetical protein